MNPELDEDDNRIDWDADWQAARDAWLSEASYRDLVEDYQKFKDQDVLDEICKRDNQDDTYYRNYMSQQESRDEKVWYKN